MNHEGHTSPTSFGRRLQGRARGMESRRLQGAGRKCKRLLGGVDRGGFPARTSHNRGNEAQGGACLSSGPNPRAGVNRRDSNREKAADHSGHSHLVLSTQTIFPKMSSIHSGCSLSSFSKHCGREARQGRKIGCQEASA